MADDSDLDLDQATRGGDRILNQEEIDNLLGFNLDDHIANDQSGIRALINSAMVSYERLPMLEIVFDRLVRLMTTSLLTSTTSVRSGSATTSTRSRCRRSCRCSAPRNWTTTAC